jgi:alkylated DNA repair dioxygenase AlkB
MRIENTPNYSILSDEPPKKSTGTDPQQFLLPDAELWYWPCWLDNLEQQQLVQHLSQLNWQQPQIQMFGRQVTIPRQQIWMGDQDAVYCYSGTSFAPEPWSAPLQQLRQRVSVFFAQPFNSVLLNHYRNGAEHMGWHSDDEKELGPAPRIVSISLGATRRFDLRHKRQGVALSLSLQPGSLLLMQGHCQAYWQHALPKQLKVLDARFNLTFRQVFSI